MAIKAPHEQSRLKGRPGEAPGMGEGVGSNIMMVLTMHADLSIIELSDTSWLGAYESKVAAHAVCCERSLHVTSGTCAPGIFCSQRAI